MTRWFGRRPQEDPELIEGSALTGPPDSADGTPSAITDSDDPGGVFGVIRLTNFWFNRELYELETDAKSQAALWAEKGLPHPSVERQGQLTVEASLAVRCVEILQTWYERVRTKMQDAIESAGQEVASKLVSLRFSLQQLERGQLELEHRDEELRRLQGTLQGPSKFGFDRLIAKPWLWIILPLLVIVEFVANFPVFRVLLPMSAALAQNADAAARVAIDKGLWSGPYHLLADLLLRPEALAVSFVAVIGIVVLSDLGGGSTRSLTALSARDNPAAAIGIGRYRAQHATRLIFCSVGLVAMMTFLYRARNTIPQTAQERVTRDSIALQATSAQRDSAVAQHRPAGELTTKYQSQQRTLDLHSQEAAYATTVQQSNGSILLLNLALILTAAALGFSGASADILDRHSEDPRLVEQRQIVADLRQQLAQLRHAARQAVADVDVGLSRIHHLQDSKPFQERAAKEDRLRGVIPLFRSENARLRMLDPSDIEAFRTLPSLDLPSLGDERFKPPVGFDQYVREAASLKIEFDRLASITREDGPDVVRVA